MTESTPKINSRYLVKKLLSVPDNTLFNHVKFHLVNDVLVSYNAKRLNILELGCGTKTTYRYLKNLGCNFDYFGVDYEASFAPDFVCDLLNPKPIQEVLPWKPDFLLLLDVLEHLHEDSHVLEKVVLEISDLITTDTKVIVTLPQMYRLDRFKFSHLHYPEHKIRLTHKEWKALLSKSFFVDKVQGVGFLSIIPFLPMFFKSFTPENKLGRLFMYLRKNVMEWSYFKPIDLWLSRTLGKVKPFYYYSNDILFVLSKKKENR
ncbi:methyltransferase domain-containing protein [Tenacibaculum tangerinum]|uniref:Methyltransferase domain-containing protein n=1 Tax=Tenacibaculum tangerinum TaxID=3038772 RepID=A0ABY8L291_9FLAO|nr:methyltransferase domain-containing protein [Tenacibaculum tangerinum]WGH74777.1 methyltransferase domain-containing protein [Tenacibaculum tangerinum]